MSIFTRTLLALSCLLLPFASPAQLTKATFGKNRLQHKEFNWRLYSTSNFDIYFYDDGQELAKLTARYIEDEYDRITDVLGYAPYSKTKVFLYNSMADMQQSNVGVNENPFTVGGQTNFVKSQVEIAFPGTLQEFKSELVLRVSGMLLMDMMFGGSLSDIFQNTYLMSLPEWFLEGAARYVAYGWGMPMDDYLRDEFLDGRASRLNKLQGQQAALIGQSIWTYIAEKHGRSNISNILNYTRIIRNEEMAIANTLGMPFRQFLNNWQTYYLSNAQDALSDYTVPEEASVVTEKRSGLQLHNSVSLSPNGRYLAYTENFRGRYSIKIKELESGKIRTVLKTGYRVLDQQTDDTIPLVDWQDSTHLGVMSVRKGLYTLYLVNVLNERHERQTIGKISQVNSFAFSPNGRVVALSAEKEGRNDIYLYSLQRRSLTAVTNDGFDDVTPTFIPGSNNILFSSNRTTDTLNRRQTVPLSDISDTYNLFIFNVDTTGNVLTRVTNSLGKNYMPTADGQGNIYFLSDQRGITNLFRYNLQDSLLNQLTNYYTSILDYSLNTSTRGLAFVALREGSERVHYIPGMDLAANRFTKATRRQGILQTRQYYQSRLQGQTTQPQRPGTRQTPATAQDSLAQPTQPRDTLAGQPALTPQDTTQTRQPAAEPEEPGLINTDNYVFEPSASPSSPRTADPAANQQQPERRTASFLSAYRQTRRKEPIQGPFQMEPRFMINNLVTSIAFDPLRASIGAGALGFVIEGELNDLLENHKIYAGVFARLDRSGDLFMEYQYLKNLIDWRVRVDRRVVLRPLPGVEKDKFVLNKGRVSMSYPFSISSRLEGGPTVATTTYLPAVDPTSSTGGLSTTRANTIYGGGHLQFVYDNTLVKGFNLFRGTRAKMGYEHMLGVAESQMSFGKLSAEIRHYQPISREITLAARAYYGRFTGSNQPLFIMGGMDNWIFNSTSRQNNPLDPFYQPSDPNRFRHQDDRNLLFHEYVTPMRGFNYNAQYGTNALLLNLELRIPLVQYFYRGPISSNFFRNLQFTGFFDIGSSWSGKPPFYRTNSVNTRPIPDTGSGFDIVVIDYRNPWLSGYGAGMRTVLLGYYAKFDVAWPVEDYESGKARYYLTLGFDF
ncbi:translocation protein TolB [Cesiribacter andamanensis]|uniref:Translocation protein TolB n=1 Tax=Cesiribacter andamanensis AMV16 TaxID=1279009 RepID=M7NB98_9BACT|nr:translocation protein TolB [Cesiribacter andamanensis]EMR04552.1 translocation protein TolB [Cesiribacter andamanensis AMV16]